MKYTILAIITLFVVSCQPKPLDIELEQAPTKLVIASQVIPNSIMLVYVSKSFGALDYSEDESGDTSKLDMLEKIMVKDANVTISYNGITDKLIAVPEAPGLYASISVPQFINTEYTLKVDDPKSALSVSSKSTMLQQVSFDEVKAKKGLNEDSINTIVEVKFTDPANELNWYMINIYSLNNGSDDPNNIFMKSTSNQVTVLLDDHSFNGQQFSGEQTMYQWESDTIFASLSNISEEYYNYLLARKKGGKIINSLLGEPINYSTNIEGGYGFFNTHFPDLQMIIVDK